MATKQKRPKLTGQALADSYALTLGHLGNVTGTYEGGGWIVVTGSGLEPHPGMKATYPNGWSLFDRVRCGTARAKIREAARA